MSNFWGAVQSPPPRLSVNCFFNSDGTGHQLQSIGLLVIPYLVYP